MGEYRREDDVLRLYFVIDYNNTQQHTRNNLSCSLQADTAVYSRPLTLCTRLTPTTRCAHNTRHTQDTSSSSNRRFCQRRRRHHDSARSPPSPHFSLSLSLDRRGGRLRLSQPSRIPSRTNNSTHTPARKREEDTLKTALTCCKHPAAAAAAATAAHLTAHTKPRLSSTGTYLIDLPLCDLTPSR